MDDANRQKIFFFSYKEFFAFLIVSVPFELGFRNLKSVHMSSPHPTGSTNDISVPKRKVEDTQKA